jgi:hypothetical protein
MEGWLSYRLVQNFSQPLRDRAQTGISSSESLRSVGLIPSPVKPMYRSLASPLNHRISIRSLHRQEAETYAEIAANAALVLIEVSCAILNRQLQHQA